MKWLGLTRLIPSRVKELCSGTARQCYSEAVVQRAMKGRAMIRAVLEVLIGVVARVVTGSTVTEKTEYSQE